ncbi:SDR family oxidoreductase [Natrinema sp. DC36]|uniref:SDR family NAD(P)-dependent oxidoreductase n=1 Tax=Natrinema sp. DC36 TaxID=2878680 RepID=UPI001CF0331E|nr:SDR family oxidoreductase [Natrinema sp. DC36]
MSRSQTHEWQDAVVVITGASRGLGRAIAEEFGARGATVVVNYRSDEEAAAKTVVAVEEAHPEAEALAVQANAGDSDAIDHLFDRVGDEYEKIDVFIHNAAVTAFKSLDEVTVKDIALTYDLGVTGFLLSAQRALDLMGDDGCIVAVSGNDSHTYMPLHGLLASAKSALECLVRYLAVEQAENGIRVNAINPGPLRKDNYYASVSSETAAAMAELEARVPKGDAVPLSAVAESVALLADPRNEWVTGEILHVDGGLAAL